LSVAAHRRCCTIALVLVAGLILPHAGQEEEQKFDFVVADVDSLIVFLAAAVVHAGRIL
jgi:hypothetical protein